MEWINLIDTALSIKSLWKIVLSHRIPLEEKKPFKIIIKPFVHKGDIKYQASLYEKDRVTHSNFEGHVLKQQILDWIRAGYRQIVLSTELGEFHLIISKKGIHLHKSKICPQKPDFDHNRHKKYILVEGVPVPSLVLLGIMDKEGKILPSKRDKFYQVNRFLELTSDVIDKVSKEKVSIVDFGCGKAYLTFAFMELMDQRQIPFQLWGIDRKKEVIDHNQKIVNDLGRRDTLFIDGNIMDSLPFSKVNIAISLHACDTATDDAILQSLALKADWILMAPCCQHELFHQLKTPVLKPLLQYGILKERLSSLLTDTIRATILEAFGYQVDVIEFVDTSHTPKNILIKAKKVSPVFSKDRLQKCKEWIENLGLTSYLFEQIQLRYPDLVSLDSF